MAVGRLATTALFGLVCALLISPSDSSLCSLRTTFRTRRLFLASSPPGPLVTTQPTTTTTRPGVTTNSATTTTSGVTTNSATTTTSGVTTNSATTTTTSGVTTNSATTTTTTSGVTTNSATTTTASGVTTNSATTTTTATASTLGVTTNSVTTTPPATTLPVTTTTTTTPNPDLNLQWNVSDNTTLSLPLEPPLPAGNLPRRRMQAAANCTDRNESVVRVSWGDGQTDICELSASACTHLYANGGVFDVAVTWQGSCGSPPAFSLRNYPPQAARGLLRACFGQHIGPEPLNGLQFANAENLRQVCPPRATVLVNATGMFSRVRQKVAGLERWNTSSVRWARDMFDGLATDEGPNISSWDLTCVAEINGCSGLEGRVSGLPLSCDIARPRPGTGEPLRLRILLDRPSNFYLPIARTTHACSNQSVLLVDWGDKTDGSRCSPRGPPCLHAYEHRGAYNITVSKLGSACVLAAFSTADLPPETSAALQAVSFGDGFALEPARGAQLRGTLNLKNLSAPAGGAHPLLNISYLFAGSGYNGSLPNWDTSSVLLASYAFSGLNPRSSINISTWNLWGLRAVDGCDGFAGNNVMLPRDWNPMVGGCSFTWTP